VDNPSQKPQTTPARAAWELVGARMAQGDARGATEALRRAELFGRIVAAGGVPMEVRL